MVEYRTAMKVQRYTYDFGTPTRFRRSVMGGEDDFFPVFITCLTFSFVVLDAPVSALLEHCIFYVLLDSVLLFVLY